MSNLAPLCLDCHNDTQIRGGFGRRLDPEQVVLYRDDWYRMVAQARASQDASQAVEKQERSTQFELVTSLAEIYRENREYHLLAVHYDSIRNKEL